MKKPLLFSVILLLVAFGLSWQIGWGATTVKKTLSAKPTTPTAITANEADPTLPPLYFYSTPDNFCSISVDNSLKASRFLFDDGTSQYGGVEGNVCYSPQDICVPKTASSLSARNLSARGPLGDSGGSSVIENTGLLAPDAYPSAPHTGNTIFCASSGRPTEVACGQTYSFDQNPRLPLPANSPKGNYCENDKTNYPGEADSKCMN